MYKVDSINQGQNPVLGFLSLEPASLRLPEIYQEVMKLAGITGSYECFTTSPKNLDEGLQNLVDIGLTGANIGAPYQEKIIPLIATLSEGANMIGAVNTIVRHGQFLKGFNTNALGLMDALAATGLKTAKCASALVLGSGGAARSALFLLRWLGIPQITVAGRDLKKTEETTLHIGGGEPVLLNDVLQQEVAADIVINTTTVSNPQAAPELANLVSRMPRAKYQMIVDFNYDNKENIWHELARAQTCSFMDGLTLVAYQTRHALTLWTGKQIPLEVVSEALKKIRP